MDSERGFTFKVLMFPWLAYGHISPFLELSIKLAERGFCIFLCSTPINLSFIKKRITQKHSHSIQLVELHLPHTTELPPSNHTTNGLPLHLNSTLRKALKSAKTNLSNILKNLNPDLVIYDATFDGQTWVPILIYNLGIPAVKFSVSSAVFGSYVYHMFRKPGLGFPFPAIYLSEFELAKARNMAETSMADDEQDRRDMPKGVVSNFLLIRSSREIEGKYFGILEDLANLKVIPVGPLFQDQPPIVGDQDENNELIDWLGKKSERSSIFVSFGTEYFLTKEEIEEIAFGLELSNVNFIWVIRFPEGEKMNPKEALPEGFEERMEERGRIVEGWAPQAKILSHKNIAGFVCHCGWSSILESIQLCVPIIAMPMQIDQPLNARLMVEIGVGVEITRDENGKFQREMISKVIKEVVLGTTGESVRKRMRDISGNMKLREKNDLNEVVAVLTQVCGSK